jgi:hypothetical protein
MTARAGWPPHRPRCRAADDSDVAETRRVVGRSPWVVRRCRACGSVALDPLNAVTTPGGAA